MISLSLIKCFMQMQLSSNLSLFRKEKMSPQFDFIYAIEKLRIFFKVFIRHETYSLNLF